MSRQLTLPIIDLAGEEPVTREILPDRVRRAQIGQFFTPPSVSQLMASFFAPMGKVVRLLDAGAGEGALLEAFVRQILQTKKKPESIQVTAYEADAQALPGLALTLGRCGELCKAQGIEFESIIYPDDFIAAAVTTLSSPQTIAGFDAAIMNPPYRKFNSSSTTRRMLRTIGIETTNLYTAFVALVCRLLKAQGQLVAITPRSFCNGPYFRSFRKEFLATMSLQRVHSYESRTAAFSDDAVLQENIIFHAIKKCVAPASVVVSMSSGGENTAIVERTVPFDAMVSPLDPEQFIRLETDDSHREARTIIQNMPCDLNDLNSEVSTGRVVDFRARQFLLKTPIEDSLPLIYPCHFEDGRICWPKTNSKKPNAIANHSETRSLFVPAGAYVLVKRFSAKEERRRIVASVITTEDVHAPAFAFENHLNYFHSHGRGLDVQFALGLAAYLNSTVVDTYFREYSGHTQVNATDLRQLKYPTRDVIMELGSQVLTFGRGKPLLDEEVVRGIV